MNIQHVLELDKSQDKSWHVARADNSFKEFGIAGGAGIESWLHKVLKFSDQFPSVCYAHGISLKILQESFPQIYSIKYHYDNVKGENWPTFENFVSNNLTDVPEEILVEIFDKNRWCWWKVDSWQQDFQQGMFNELYINDLNVLDQFEFIKSHKTRIPKKILEIGGGRGEIANFFKFLKIDCISIEPGQYARDLYETTGVHFFGELFESATPMICSLGDLNNELNLSLFDTIIFCESIEHIPEADFWKFWDLVQKVFQGRIIITNNLFYHPIPISLPEHIFEINDNVYNKLVSQSRSCIYRNNSHLVLEI